MGGAYTIYTWDHRDRLTSVTDYADATTITGSVAYRTNADDQQVERTRTYYDEGSVDNLFTSHFTYDGRDLVLDVDPELGQRHRYLWGPVVDQLLADDGNDPINFRNSPALERYLFNDVALK